MRRRDMEQNSQGFGFRSEPGNVTNSLHPAIQPVNTVPNLESHLQQEPHGSNSMFYGYPEYHHQRVSNMPAAPNFHPPYADFHAPPPSHLLPPGMHGDGVPFPEQERNAYFTDHGFKRKIAEVIPEHPQYLSSAAPGPYYFPQPNTLETAPFTFPQPLDQRSVRDRAGAATVDPLLSHGHNSFVQGNSAAHPFPPPGAMWYDQQCSGNISDGSSSLWPQPTYVPYAHGNVVTGSVDSGNGYFQRSHETSNSRSSTPFVYPRHNYINYHPVPPPPTVYPHIASASYSIPETMHDASYGHVGPVQSTRLRIHQQHSREDYLPAMLRPRELPHFRMTAAEEVALMEGGDFYDAANYVDHHEDMRLDIEDMSYEELLALSDHIGTVRTGLSEKDVKNLLKRRTSVANRINLEEAPSTDLETDSCSICLEVYNHRDKIAALDCKHEYHTECLKKWLVIKNVCPICKSEALVMDKKKRFP